MKPTNSKKILILSGPTYEFIDPVRFIGNRSSGKMGKCLAEVAASLGGLVHFVSGPVSQSNYPRHPVIRVIDVTSGDEMWEECLRLYDEADIIICVAAVSDYKPKKKMKFKISKDDESLNLDFVKNVDIAESLGKIKKDEQILIGFALETNDAKKNAQKKLIQKNMDGIILNSVDSIGSENGTFHYLSSSSNDWKEWGSIGKNECAKKIFKEINALSKLNLVHK